MDRRFDQIALGGRRVVYPDTCYSVSETPTGQLLVGRKKKFDILNCDSKSVEVTPGMVIGIQTYNQSIYTLRHDVGLVSNDREIKVFDRTTFKEVGSLWAPFNSFPGNLAVINDKVYVPDVDSKRLCTFSLSGRELEIIKNPSFVTPANLCVNSPDSIIICDREANKVHKLDSRTDTITWTCELVNCPVAACCDTNSDVWVWSEDSNCIIRLTSLSG